MAILLLFLVTGPVQGQRVTWEVLNDPDGVAGELSLPDAGGDSLVQADMRNILTGLHYDGYLEASYGLGAENDSLRYGKLFVGPRWEWAWLGPGNVPEVVLARAGYRPRDFRDKPLRLAALQRLIDQVLSYSEEHGYPFAAIWIDSVQLEEERIRGRLAYDPGPEITFDSLRLQGYEGVKTPWLMSYLQISPGTPFDQKSLELVPGRIRRLPFVKLSGEPALTFQNESARLYLPLERVPSNRIDGVVGFLPNEENDGGLRITGQLDLSLQNLFNSGKQLDIAWQRVKPLSQTLEVAYRHPNVLRSPLHFSGDFGLLKEDSTFINRHFRLALGFTRGVHELAVFTRLKRTRLLSASQFADVTELPDYADQNVNYYGLEYNAALTADGWSGNKGWSVAASGAIGDKMIRRNAALPDEVYENADLNTLQWTAEVLATAGLQAGQRSLAYARLYAGFIDDDQLFLNDMFRLGGLRTLRGFTENNFFTSSFAVLTMEYQLFFESFSYLFLFIDQGIVANSLAETGTIYPTGLGAGLTLRTGGGDLQLAWALGRTEDQSFNLSLSKFHFGYIAKF